MLYLLIAWSGVVAYDAEGYSSNANVLDVVSTAAEEVSRSVATAVGLSRTRPAAVAVRTSGAGWATASTCSTTRTTG